MNKLLSVIRIRNEEYYVDTKRDQFRSVKEPKKVIPFYRTIVLNHEVYVPFDKETGEPYPGKITNTLFENPSVKMEAVPKRFVLPALNNKAAIPQDNPHDSILDIEGTYFRLDFQRRQLVQLDQPENILRFDDMLTVQNDQLTFWYDSQNKNIFKGSVLELESNPAIQKIQIHPSYRVKNLTPRQESIQTLIDVVKGLRAEKVTEGAAEAAAEKPERQRRKGRGM